MQKEFKVRNYTLTDEEYSRLSISGKKSYKFDELIELFANEFVVTEENTAFYEQFKTIALETLEDIDIRKSIQFLERTKENPTYESWKTQSTIFDFMS